MHSQAGQQQQLCKAVQDFCTHSLPSLEPIRALALADLDWGALPQQLLLMLGMELHQLSCEVLVGLRAAQSQCLPTHQTQYVACVSQVSVSDGAAGARQIMAEAT